MTTNFSMLFYMKKPSYYKSAPAPIYVRLTVNGSRSECATGKSCEPDRWNGQANRAKGNKEETKSFNWFLDDLQVKINEAHRRVAAENAPFTAEDLKTNFSERTKRAICLSRCSRSTTKKWRNCLGKDIQKVRDIDMRHRFVTPKNSWNTPIGQTISTSLKSTMNL